MHYGNTGLGTMQNFAQIPDTEWKDKYNPNATTRMN